MERKRLCDDITEINTVAFFFYQAIFGLHVLGRRRKQARSSEEERRVDARALIADEGRDKLRKASGSRK